MLPSQVGTAKNPTLVLDTLACGTRIGPIHFESDRIAAVYHGRRQGRPRADKRINDGITNEAELPVQPTGQLR